MIPLVITDVERANIRAVKAYAEAHKCFLPELLRRVAGNWEPVGDDPQFTVEIPRAYRVVYSIEQQPPPTGWCHHLSISCAVKGRAPNVPAILMVLREFGVDIETLDGCPLWMEEKGLPAVNVLVPFNREPRRSPEPGVPLTT